MEGWECGTQGTNGLHSDVLGYNCKEWVAQEGRDEPDHLKTNLEPYSTFHKTKLNYAK